MKTVCKGKILSNGVCDTCYQLSQSSSGDCGRLIDLSLEAPENNGHSYTECMDYGGDSVPLVNTVGEQPAQPVDKLPIGWAEAIVKAKEFFGETRWSLMGSKMQSDIIEWGFFVDMQRVSPSPERGESKKAKNTDEAWFIQETYKGNPHGWVQWKGTDVCMDIHCKCGHHSHIDDSFVYHIECPKCKTVYMVNGHVELIEIEERPEGTKSVRDAK